MVHFLVLPKCPTAHKTADLLVQHIWNEIPCNSLRHCNQPWSSVYFPSVLHIARSLHSAWVEHSILPRSTSACCLLILYCHATSRCLLLSPAMPQPWLTPLLVQWLNVALPPRQHRFYSNSRQTLPQSVFTIFSTYQTSINLFQLMSPAVSVSFVLVFQSFLEIMLTFFFITCSDVCTEKKNYKLYYELIYKGGTVV